MGSICFQSERKDVQSTKQQSNENENANTAGSTSSSPTIENNTNTQKQQLITDAEKDLNNQITTASNTAHGVLDDSIPPLEGAITAERYLIYKDKIMEKLKEGGNTEINISKITSLLPNSEESEEKDEIIEKMIVSFTARNGDAFFDGHKEIFFSCSICMDDELTPSQLIEYTFDNERWFLANICTECNSYYRSTKFENWKQHFENETCEAALRRLVRIGPITHMFDNVVYSSPEEEQHLYEVTNHQGKTVQIPRPVSSMRIWNASDKKYDGVQARLDNIPETEEELQEVWQQMLAGISAKFGGDIITSWQNETTPGGPTTGLTASDPPQ